MRWSVQLTMCLIAALSLGGCAAAPSEPAASRIVTVARAVCPGLVAYSVDAQGRVADAIEHRPRDDPVAGMIEDYGRLRAALRAACKDK